MHPREASVDKGWFTNPGELNGQRALWDIGSNVEGHGERMLLRGWVVLG